MVIINHPGELNQIINKPISLVISYNFLTIYGLPFILLYSTKLKKLNKDIKIALELNNELATATLAILENFPYIIINKNLHNELNKIKSNCKSSTKILSSITEFTS